MKYFAYGMNTNMEEMAHRCPKARTLGQACLPGYRFAFYQHADIVNDDSTATDGVLWEITDDCLASLDILEGYPYHYTRFEVYVEYQGEIVQATTYQMTPENQVPDLPSASYYFMITKGYDQHSISHKQLTEALTETYNQVKEIDQYFSIT